MVFELDPSLHPDLAPLAWLVGRWEGAGVIGYPTMDSYNFGQEIEVTHDTRPFLTWRATSWKLDEAGEKVSVEETEQGYWRAFGTDEVELIVAHPTGILELYYGSAANGKIEVQTDGVLRSPHSPEYSAAQRLYGNVNSNLMWATDIAAHGHPLTPHASAELTRVG